MVHACRVEVREVVAKLRGGKAPEICNISVEFFKKKTHGSHVVLAFVWHSGDIFLSLEEGTSPPYLETIPSGLLQLVRDYNALHAGQGAYPSIAGGYSCPHAEASET